MTQYFKSPQGYSHGLLEVDGILTSHGPVLGLALDVDNLVLGESQSSQHRVPGDVDCYQGSNDTSRDLSHSPDQETEPGLALLLALPHPALVQPDQVQQEHVPEGGGGDLTPGAGGGRGLLEDGGRRVARGQPQH